MKSLPKLILSCTGYFRIPQNRILLILKRFKILLSHPYHAYLVSIFYVWNGFLLNKGLIEVKSLLGLLLFIGVVQGFLFLMFKKFYRSDSHKAGLLLTFLTISFLFFGIGQDFVSSIRAIAFLGKLKWFLLICGSLFTLMGIWLKQLPAVQASSHRYLNLLFIIYILFQPFLINDVQPEIDSSLKVVDQPVQEKPSVYLLVFDMYTGFDGQQKYFNSIDTSMKTKLRQLEFHLVPHSKSNYFFTVYSMASMLHMNYLQGIAQHMEGNTYHYQQSLRTLKQSNVVGFFKNLGYKFNNLSSFELANAPAFSSIGFLPHGLSLLTQQTLYGRVSKSILHWAATQHLIPPLKLWVTEKEMISDQILIAKTIAVSKKDTGSLFHYLHVNMPHDPFWFDRDGKKVPEQPPYTSLANENLYFEYLNYTNRVMYNLCEQIKKNTHGKAVILLMSDHGYRYPLIQHKFDQLRYSNINAIYLPKGNYRQWSDTTTNVNQFRILFNTLFDQKIPLLPDTTVN